MKKISITSSCYNEEENLPELHRRLTDVIAKFPQYDYEIKILIKVQKKEILTIKLKI